MNTPIAQDWQEIDTYTDDPGALGALLDRTSTKDHGFFYDPVFGKVILYRRDGDDVFVRDAVCDPKNCSFTVCVDRPHDDEDVRKLIGIALQEGRMSGSFIHGSSAYSFTKSGGYLHFAEYRDGGIMPVMGERYNGLAERPPEVEEPYLPHRRLQREASQGAIKKSDRGKTTSEASAVAATTIMDKPTTVPVVTTTDIKPPETSMVAAIPDNKSITAVSNHAGDTSPVGDENEDLGDGYTGIREYVSGDHARYLWIERRMQKLGGDHGFFLDFLDDAPILLEFKTRKAGRSNRYELRTRQTDDLTGFSRMEHFFTDVVARQYIKKKVRDTGKGFGQIKYKGDVYVFRVFLGETLIKGTPEIAEPDTEQPETFIPGDESPDAQVSNGFLPIRKYATGERHALLLCSRIRRHSYPNSVFDPETMKSLIVQRDGKKLFVKEQPALSLDGSFKPLATLVDSQSNEYRRFVRYAEKRGTRGSAVLNEKRMEYALRDGSLYVRELKPEDPEPKNEPEKIGIISEHGPVQNKLSLKDALITWV